MEADVTSLTADDIPEANAWVAGFPCQPFSSSGNRQGFAHRSGNVFEHLARLMESRRPSLAVFENVEGLLTNKSGHTLAVILSRLASLGYTVSWLLVNLRWFGPPQTRERLFLIAALPGVLNRSPLYHANEFLPGIAERESNAFARLLVSKGVSWMKRCEGHLADAEEQLRPAVGKPRPLGKFVFGPLGHCTNSGFSSFDISSSKLMPISSSLPRSIVAPSFGSAAQISSARFWTTDSGRGPTKLWLRSEPVSHCIGTSLGGAPLYAVPLSCVENPANRAAFLEFSNWHRESKTVSSS